MWALRHVSMVALAMSTAVACAADDDGRPSGFPYSGTPDPNVAERQSTGHDETSGSTGEDAPDDDGASGASSDGSGGTSAGSAGTFTPLEGDGGAADGSGHQPSDGWWSACLDAPDCDPGFACLGTDEMTDGVCTAECVPFGTADSCGASPGGTAVPTCLVVGGHSICALDCSGGRSCAGGMSCLADHDDLGPISICL